MPGSPMGLTITRQALSELLNGRKGLSPEMASRIAEVFGSTAETWLGMQMAYDQWQAHGAGSTRLATQSLVSSPGPVTR